MSNEGYEYLFILDIQQILLIPIVDIQEIIASSMSNFLSKTATSWSHGMLISPSYWMLFDVFPKKIRGNMFFSSMCLAAKEIFVCLDGTWAFLTPLFFGPKSQRWLGSSSRAHCWGMLDGMFEWHSYHDSTWVSAIKGTSGGTPKSSKIISVLKPFGYVWKWGIPPIIAI
jgi:hypothetical protein